MIPNCGSEKPNFSLDNTILHRISPGPSRVLVGVNTFNDENQQNLRIQQAVNRYNGTGLPPYWRPSSTFKCNLFKGKALNPFANDDSVPCEDPKLKPETRYASPGHFPTVLLGKHQMRPSTKQSILSQLRSNTSGLPASRVLDDSAEKYSDTKPTRSVLEVLQDLSRKRIHGKDDGEESSKKRCKGLGGDLVNEGEIPFQPLFVSKLKNKIFPKKDQMTQTLSNLNLTEFNKSTSAHDSKSELRKKLAQKNNEIFASLSSSIAGAFFAKRKRVSNSTFADVEEKSTKRKKVETSVLKSDDIQHFDPVKKIIRKEHGPRSPPTKDKLMNIYFDLQSNSNVKGEVIKAMTSETGGSQFQRSVGTDDKNNSTSETNYSIKKAINSPSSSEVPFTQKPLKEVVPTSSTTATSFPEKNLSPKAFDLKESIEKPSGQFDTKLEKLNPPGVVEAPTPYFPNPNTSTFTPSVTPLQKDTKSLVDSSVSVLPKIHSESDQITSSKIVSTQIGSINSEVLLSGLQPDKKSLPLTTPVKGVFNINADNNKTMNSYNLGISKPEKENPIASLPGLKPVANTKLGFSFGDSNAALPKSTFSLSPAKGESSPTSSFNQANTTLSPPKFGENFSNAFLSPTSSTNSGGSTTIIKPADTTSTFSFGNLKPTSSASVSPSMLTSVLQKSTSDITSPTSSIPTPLFSFGQSAPGNAAKSSLFSFGSDPQTVKKECNTDGNSNRNESFSFGQSSKPISLNLDSEVKANINQDSAISKDNKPSIAGFFSSTVNNENIKSSSFPSSNVFTRLGSEPGKGSIDKNNAPVYELKPKEDESKNISVGNSENDNRIVFGVSKISNDSNLFDGGSLFGSNLATKADIKTTLSAPLFSQTSSPIATSNIFNFKPSDQSAFKFQTLSGANETSKSTETKAFVFGSTPKLPSVSDNKTGPNNVNDITPTTTTVSTSIFSFGSDKPAEGSSNFTFGKLPSAPSTQPFSFGASQSDASITSSSPFPTPISTGSSKTIVGFGTSTPSQTLTGNQTPASVPTTAPPAFSATSAFSFGSTTSNSTPFGTTNNVFGATTSANSVFGQTTPSFGTTTTAPPTFGSGTNFNTTTAASLTFGSGTSSYGTATTTPPTFGSGTTFNSTTAASMAFGSGTSSFGTATSGIVTFGNTNTTSAPPAPLTFGASTSAPITFGSGTSFGTAPSASTFGNPNAFGTTTSSSFGSTTAFGSNTTTPSAFGASTAFVTTTSSSSTFGSVPTFGSTSSPNTTSIVTSGYGTPAGTTAFGNNNAASPFASSNNTFGSSQLSAFGNTGTAFSNSTNAFGNTVLAPTFGNSPPAYTANTGFGNASTSGNNNSAFGNASLSASSPTPFGNSNPTSTTFGFGAVGTTTNSTVPSFNFGAAPTASSPANNSFNFGNPSTGGSSGSSVFNFGGNSASSNAKPFCFGSNTSGSSGYSQSTPGPSGFPSTSSPFNTAPTPNASTSFSLPGTFSIGSGTTQPRSRTVSRFRRRT